MYILPLWPLLLLCIRSIYYVGDASGISLSQAVATLAIIGTTAWCYTVVGMLFSWLCRRTVAAVGWTLATLLAVNLFLPMFLQPFNRYRYDGADWTLLINPLVALVKVVEPRSLDRSSSAPLWDQPVPGTLLTTLLLSAIGCVLLIILHGFMWKRARQRDTA